jgi:hypothetical protein
LFDFTGVLGFIEFLIQPSRIYEVLFSK